MSNHAKYTIVLLLLVIILCSCVKNKKSYTKSKIDTLTHEIKPGVRRVFSGLENVTPEKREKLKETVIKFSEDYIKQRKDIYLNRYPGLEIITVNITPKKHYFYIVYIERSFKTWFETGYVILDTNISIEYRTGFGEEFHLYGPYYVDVNGDGILDFVTKFADESLASVNVFIQKPDSLILALFNVEYDVILDYSEETQAVNVSDNNKYKEADSLSRNFSFINLDEDDDLEIKFKYIKNLEDEEEKQYKDVVFDLINEKYILIRKAPCLKIDYQ